MLPAVKAKIFSMKKSERFYAIPNDDGNIIAEADNYICIFDKFGNGMFATKGVKTEKVKFPEQFVIDCMIICPAIGKITYLDGEVEA